MRTTQNPITSGSDTRPDNGVAFGGPPTNPTASTLPAPGLASPAQSGDEKCPGPASDRGANDRSFRAVEKRPGTKIPREGRCVDCGLIGDGPGPICRACCRRYSRDLLEILSEDEILDLPPGETEQVEEGHPATPPIKARKDGP
jgi:hypothetical protein